MNSAKNTVVAILLLGVSYGVYQVINAPDTGDPLAGLMKMVEPSGNPAASADASAEKTGSSGDWNTSFTAPEPPALPSMPSQPPVLNKLEPAPANQSTASPKQPNAQPPGIGGFASPDRAPANSPATSSFSSPESGLGNLAPIKPKTEISIPRFGPIESGPQSTATFGPAPGGSLAGVPAALAPLNEVWPAAEQMVNAGNFRDALEKLTPYLERTGSSSPDHERLTHWLDALALKVVYSTEHRLDSTPYIVRAGETLDSLSASWGVPAEFIYKVNAQRIPNPSELTPGIELKKIAGPCRASVSKTDRELTLYVSGLYAGRFPLAGDTSSLQSGAFHITRKQKSGSQCGDYCLETNQPGLALHAAGPGAPSTGTLSFQTADAEDLFVILPEGSEVLIR